MVDFASCESIIKLIDANKGKDKDNNPGSLLASRVGDFYNNWKVDDKTIEQIIKECGSNKNLGAAPSAKN